MFDALLRVQLGPIVERLAEMEAQLEDLYRRAESFCRIGICQEVDAASNINALTQEQVRLRETLETLNSSLSNPSRSIKAPDPEAAAPLVGTKPGGLLRRPAGLAP